MLRRAGFSTRPHRVLLAKETTLMTQNRITLTFPPADLAAIAAAIETLEDKFVNLVDLSVSERRHLVKKKLPGESNKLSGESNKLSGESNKLSGERN
jgi:hypothetical protein